jgi:hypothetical protein
MSRAVSGEPAPSSAPKIISPGQSVYCVRGRKQRSAGRVLGRMAGAAPPYMRPEGWGTTPAAGSELPEESAASTRGVTPVAQLSSDARAAAGRGHGSSGGAFPYGSPVG